MHLFASPCFASVGPGLRCLSRPPRPSPRGHLASLGGLPRASGAKPGRPCTPPDIVELWVRVGLTPRPLQAALPPQGRRCHPGTEGSGAGAAGAVGAAGAAGAAVPEPAVASVPVTCAAPGPPAALAATSLRRPPCLRQQRARSPPSRGRTPRESVREGGPSAVLASPKLLRWTPSPRDGIGRGRPGGLRVRTAVREPETGPHRPSVCTEIWDSGLRNRETRCLSVCTSPPAAEPRGLTSLRAVPASRTGPSSPGPLRAARPGGLGVGPRCPALRCEGAGPAGDPGSRDRRTPGGKAQGSGRPERVLAGACGVHQPCVGWARRALSRESRRPSVRPC